MRSQFIAVAEDSDEDFDTAMDAARFGEMQFPIVRARSGAECLQLLRDSLDRREAQPVLLLLDLNMPGLDGRDVLREMRSDAAPRNVPVVVLSASANPRDLEFCYTHGVNAYHVKPVNHALHLRVLQDIFTYWLGSVVLPT